jgi:hypothetical protein
VTGTNGAAEEGKFIRLTAAVTDDVQVRNVEFYVDGVRVLTDGNFPFEHRFVTPRRSATKTNLTIRAKATDTGGNFAWSDEIMVTLTPDVTRPQVGSVVPTPNSVATNSNVLVFFSEPIDAASLNLTSFRVLSAGPDFLFGTADDVLVPGIISYREEINAASFAYPPVLPYGLYRGTVTTNVTDVAGNRLRAEFTWSFSVASTGAEPDSDMDGWPDGNERLYGTDPSNPASRPRIPQVLVSAPVTVRNLTVNPPVPTNAVLVSLPVTLLNAPTNPPTPTSALLPSPIVTYENR